MPALLFKLRNVPDDEAEEIRELLGKHNIEFYETPAGRWGISMEAIWVKDETVLEEARRIIEEYQVQRYRKVREEYEDSKEHGNVETFAQRLMNRPFQMIAYLAIILVILYFVTMPFVKLSAD